MTTWAIGDIQGCDAALGRLLDKIRPVAGTDRLWFCGDLVNRGPDSAAVLRRLMTLDISVDVVLGNHDLHLLAIAHGCAQIKKKDTLSEVLDAPDASRLLDWLLQQPLALVQGHQVLVHAGVSPEWSLQTLAQQAELAGQAMRDAPTRFFGSMYGNSPTSWRDAHSNDDRLRYTVNSLTRMRYCDAAGHLDFRHKGAPGSQPPELMPWFAHPNRVVEQAEVFFGHWSTLGKIAWPTQRVYGLDTGCVWGGQLTAIDIDSKRTLSIPA